MCDLILITLSPEPSFLHETMKLYGYSIMNKPLHLGKGSSKQQANDLIIILRVSLPVHIISIYLTFGNSGYQMSLISCTKWRNDERLKWVSI